MEIEEIVTRCKQGEKEAFRELLQTVEKKALATAYFFDVHVSLQDFLNL